MQTSVKKVVCMRVMHRQLEQVSRTSEQKCQQEGMLPPTTAVVIDNTIGFIQQQTMHLSVSPVYVYHTRTSTHPGITHTHTQGWKHSFINQM